MHAHTHTVSKTCKAFTLPVLITKGICGSIGQKHQIVADTLPNFPPLLIFNFRKLLTCIMIDSTEKPKS